MKNEGILKEEYRLTNSKDKYYNVYSWKNLTPVCGLLNFWFTNNSLLLQCHVLFLFYSPRKDENLICLTMPTKYNPNHANDSIIIMTSIWSEDTNWNKNNCMPH